MGYVITDNTDGSTEVLSESKAEQKFGVNDFNRMVFGVHERFTATNMNVAADDDYTDVYDFDELGS